MNIKDTFMVLSMCFVLAIGACKKEESTPILTNTTNNNTPSNLKLIGETYIIGAQAKAIVYANKDLFVGYNNIYIALFDSSTGVQLENGDVTIIPVMDMGTMMHSAPVEQPIGIDPTNKLWAGAIVFIMPSMGGKWELKITFNNAKNNLLGEGLLEINVIQPAVSVMNSYTVASDDSAKIFVSLVKPAAPQIGLNDFEITIHQKSSMMSFPSIDQYTVEIEPEMPSMGHGSPNNVNPNHIGLGHYSGKVNFTMTGFWRVHYKLFKNGQLIDDTHYFDITF